MNTDEYQSWVESVMLSGDQDEQTVLFGLMLGLGEEAGEVLGKWKKITFYKDGKYTKDDIEEVKKELGDTLWYITALANKLGLSLQEIIDKNVEKGNSRKVRGVQKGEGDNR
jgi:NTP pyrophosphatase (non-canonical NTP hydrolase)